MAGEIGLEPWSVVAQNLPEHARNPIHTDAGAQAAGFARALVAGVTTYAYLTHVPLAAWGLEWLRSGGGEVRFRRPVFDGVTVVCRPSAFDPFAVEAVTGEPDQPRAVLVVRSAGGQPFPVREGERLDPREIRLDGEWGSDYGARAGDELALCQRHGVAHPAVWPALANHIVHTQVARGSWIHTRSDVRHHALAPAGATAIASGIVVRRFATPHGERAVLDVRVEVDGVLVATLEHEAIVALP